MMDFQAWIVSCTGSRDSRFQPGFITNKNELNIRVLVGSRDGCRHDNIQTGITAHCIERNRYFITHDVSGRGR